MFKVLLKFNIFIFCPSKISLKNCSSKVRNFNFLSLLLKSSPIQLLNSTPLRPDGFCGAISKTILIISSIVSSLSNTNMSKTFYRNFEKYVQIFCKKSIELVSHHDLYLYCEEHM